MSDLFSPWFVTGCLAPCLQDWWNTYDELTVAARAPLGSGAVNASELSEAEALAAWLEAAKFGPKISGERLASLGGSMWEDIGNTAF